MNKKQLRTNKIEDFKQNILFLGLGYFIFDSGTKMIMTVTGLDYVTTGIGIVAMVLVSVRFGLFDSLFS